MVRPCGPVAGSLAVDALPRLVNACWCISTTETCGVRSASLTGSSLALSNGVSSATNYLELLGLKHVPPYAYPPTSFSPLRSMGLRPKALRHTRIFKRIAWLCAANGMADGKHCNHPMPGAQLPHACFITDLHFVYDTSTPSTLGSLHSYGLLSCLEVVRAESSFGRAT